ncbi:MAG: alcohol dehydrogenase catalytic domain-containing protein [Nitrospirae bacterium]|nr:alcohol dehydrogenase catalytic domain-containing protein [Nitrospirota bacterium]
MKVAVYHNNSDVRIEERPIPAIGDGEILVKMKASGICGTDVMQWYRIKKGPRVLGHEMAGEIVETGNGVEQFKSGDRVFVSHHVPCYSCVYCDQGNYTACETLHTGNYEPGGFSEYIRVPALNVKTGTFLLPAGMSYETATMIEPLACAVLGQKSLDVKKGQTVVVFGSGISGLLHIQMSKLKGAKVIATDINKYRLNKALEFGADHAIHASEYSVEKLKELNNGRLADRIVVCAGAKQAVASAVESIDKRGVILFFAVPQEDICIPSVNFWRDEISVRFSYGASPQDLKEALALIETNAVDVQKMITHKVSLSGIQEGFRMVSEAADSLKVAVIPDDSIK